MQSQHSASLKNSLVSDAAKEDLPKESSWLFWSFFATFCFLAVNGLVSEITIYSGPFASFYMASGGITAGVVFNIYKVCKTGKPWVNQNIIVDGKFKVNNLFGFVMNCVVYVIVNNVCFVTMYFTNEAGINVGVITTIWCVFPLYTALADYWMFKTKLEYYHWIGLTSIIICSLFISA
jgi:multidrug transporter EmrE-like cation transporter